MNVIFIFALMMGAFADESEFITIEDYKLCQSTNWNKIVDDWMAEGNTKSLYPNITEPNDHEHKVLNENAKVMWPNGIIPYKIDPGFSKKDRAGIACAMVYMEKHTCLRFKPKKGELAELERPVLIFTPENWGGFCMTDWRTNGVGWTWVKLHLSTDSVCTFGRTLIHEIVHGLSGRHTQTRYDRDAHIEVMWDNIYDDKKDQFKICDYKCEFNQAFPYDCESVMHYARNQMGIDKSKPTMGKIS